MCSVNTPLPLTSHTRVFYIYAAYLCVMFVCTYFTRDRYSHARVYIHMQMDKCTNWLMSREPVLSRGEWLPVRRRRGVDIALVSLCKGWGVITSWPTILSVICSAFVCDILECKSSYVTRELNS